MVSIRTRKPTKIYISGMEDLVCGGFRKDNSGNVAGCLDYEKAGDASASDKGHLRAVPRGFTREFVEEIEATLARDPDLDKFDLETRFSSLNPQKQE